MTRAYRSWCARGQYPGKDAFLFGTVWAETEMEALRALEAAWAKVLPHPPPPLTAIPGGIFFRSEDE